MPRIINSNIDSPMDAYRMRWSGSSSHMQVANAQRHEPTIHPGASKQSRGIDTNLRDWRDNTVATAIATVSMPRIWKCMLVKTNDRIIPQKKPATSVVTPIIK
mmetsp:Transcript_73623/g.148946  ORF Transcript_73623/g.148946 Transcript_73623/m.148946 type:complete len:103 (+) Transcript_73623:469-777(+)